MYHTAVSLNIQML